jgi:hypothetical protein
MHRGPVTIARTWPLDAALVEIFDLLKAVAAARCGGAPLRVAGGWVRDMLLERTSHDIDIAIETPAGHGELVTGAVFANNIQAYLQGNTEMAARFPIGTLSVIKTNPEKSKHIETAQIRIRDIPLEFCHLRHDEYSTDHRVPIVRPGTPLEDALRRDFTCNALFYNLQSDQVEDFCNGFEDLRQAVLRCPLDPFETFMDDPLRILRAVRFGGQLGFTLDGSIAAALGSFPTGENADRVPPMAYPFTKDLGQLHPLCHALIHKVSRERSAIELQKMLSGHDPRGCISMLAQLGILFPAVLVEAHFSVKPKSKTAKPDIIVPVVQPGSNIAAVQDEIARWTQVLVDLPVPASDPIGSNERAILALLGVLGPALAEPSDVNLDLRTRVEGVIVRWMKLPNYTSNTINAVLAAAALIAPHAEVIARPNADQPMHFIGEARTAIYRLLRTLQVLSDQLPPMWLVAASIACGLLRAGAPTDDIARLVHQAVSAIEADCGGELLHSCVAAPRFTGDKLPALIGVARQDIGKAVEAQRVFQLHHPGCSDEEVLAFLRAGGSPPAQEAA